MSALAALVGRPGARLGLLLAALVAVWAPDAILGDTVFFAHDLRTHHLPWRVWAAGEWAAGRLPLWAPGVATGFPLAADSQTGAWYPPGMLLFGLLSPANALNADMLLHIWWAGLGAGLFVMALGVGAEGALLAAVGYAFSGFLVSHGHYLGFQNAAAWLPWLLLAIARGRRAGIALCVVMLLVAGHPQVAAISLLMGLAFAVHRRALPAVFLGFGLGGLAAGPQILCTLELVRFSLRDGGLSDALANQGSMPPPELLGAVLPSIFGFERPGDIAQSYYHRGLGYWGLGENHWEMCFYLGLPVVVLALVGARGRSFWWGLILVSAALMLGGYGPLWPFVRHIPGLEGFRYPVRFALLLTLGVTVLAAFGLDFALSAPAAQLRLWARRLLIAALAFVGAASLTRGALDLGGPALRGALLTAYEARAARKPLPPTDLSVLELAALPPAEGSTPELGARKVDAVLASLERSTEPSSALVFGPMAILMGLALLLHLRAGGRLSEYGLGLAVPALLFLDLFAFGATYQERYSRALVESRPAALAPIEAEGGRWRTTVLDRRQDPALDMELMNANLGLLFGTRDVIIPSPLRVVRQEALLSAAGLDVGDTGPQKASRLLANLPLVDLLGVRWLLTTHELRASRLSLVQRGAVNLYRNAGALPGAFLVGCAARPPQDADPAAWAWEQIRRVDPRKIALVEPSGDGAAGLAVPACADGSGAGEAWIVQETPTQMEIRVEARLPAVLVQNDTWYPGWSATLDDAPTPLLRTDLAFRGVIVPEGTHIVQLRYQPTGMSAAIGLACLALAATLGLAVWEARQRRVKGTKVQVSIEK